MRGNSGNTNPTSRHGLLVGVVLGAVVGGAVATVLARTWGIHTGAPQAGAAGDPHAADADATGGSSDGKCAGHDGPPPHLRSSTTGSSLGPARDAPPAHLARQPKRRPRPRAERAATSTPPRGGSRFARRKQRLLRRPWTPGFLSVCEGAWALYNHGTEAVYTPWDDVATAHAGMTGSELMTTCPRFSCVPVMSPAGDCLLGAVKVKHLFCGGLLQSPTAVGDRLTRVMRAPVCVANGEPLLKVVAMMQHAHAKFAVYVSDAARDEDLGADRRVAAQLNACLQACIEAAHRGVGCDALLDAAASDGHAYPTGVELRGVVMLASVVALMFRGAHGSQFDLEAAVDGATTGDASPTGSGSSKSSDASSDGEHSGYQVEDGDNDAESWSSGHDGGTAEHGSGQRERVGSSESEW